MLKTAPVRYCSHSSRIVINRETRLQVIVERLIEVISKIEEIFKRDPQILMDNRFSLSLSATHRLHSNTLSNFYSFHVHVRNDAYIQHIKKPLLSIFRKLQDPNHKLPPNLLYLGSPELLLNCHPDAPDLFDVAIKDICTDNQSLDGLKKMLHTFAEGARIRNRERGRITSFLHLSEYYVGRAVIDKLIHQMNLFFSDELKLPDCTLENKLAALHLVQMIGELLHNVLQLAKSDLPHSQIYDLRRETAHPKSYHLEMLILEENNLHFDILFQGLKKARNLLVGILNRYPHPSEEETTTAFWNRLKKGSQEEPEPILWEEFTQFYRFWNHTEYHKFRSKREGFDLFISDIDIDDFIRNFLVPSGLTIESYENIPCIKKMLLEDMDEETYRRKSLELNFKMDFKGFCSLKSHYAWFKSQSEHHRKEAFHTEMDRLFFFSKKKIEQAIEKRQKYEVLVSVLKNAREENKYDTWFRYCVEFFPENIDLCEKIWKEDPLNDSKHSESFLSSHELWLVKRHSFRQKLSSFILANTFGYSEALEKKVTFADKSLDPTDKERHYFRVNESGYRKSIHDLNQYFITIKTHEEELLGTFWQHVRGEEHNFHSTAQEEHIRLFLEGRRSLEGENFTKEHARFCEALCSYGARNLHSFHWKTDPATSPFEKAFYTVHKMNIATLADKQAYRKSKIEKMIDWLKNLEDVAEIHIDLLKEMSEKTRLSFLQGNIELNSFLFYTEIFKKLDTRLTENPTKRFACRFLVGACYHLLKEIDDYPEVKWISNKTKYLAE